MAVNSITNGNAVNAYTITITKDMSVANAKNFGNRYSVSVTLNTLPGKRRRLRSLAKARF